MMSSFTKIILLALMMAVLMSSFEMADASSSSSKGSKGSSSGGGVSLGHSRPTDLNQLHNCLLFVLLGAHVQLLLSFSILYYSVGVLETPSTSIRTLVNNPLHGLKRLKKLPQDACFHPFRRRRSTTISSTTSSLMMLKIRFAGLESTRKATLVFEPIG